MKNKTSKFYIKQEITLPKTSKLNEEIIRQLDHLLEFAPPLAYRETILELYHTYIRYEHDTLPISFEEMANQIYFLMGFLKTASREMNGEGQE